MKKISLKLIALLIVFASCEANNKVEKTTEKEEEVNNHSKELNDSLPTIGLLVYSGVLTTEVTAAADVFTKLTADGKKLFNVVVIAQEMSPIKTEEELTLLPDFTFENCPKLDVLFVPSAYDMYTTIRNEKIVSFIKAKNEETHYTVSNCGGAQLIGKSGIAKGKKIVTWIGGGEQLQKDYSDLLVQNDSLVSYVEDGKFLSSNGNLASYISSLMLLEKMTNKEHREFVESYLYLDRLQDWKR